MARSNESVTCKLVSTTPFNSATVGMVC